MPHTQRPNTNKPETEMPETERPEIVRPRINRPQKHRPETEQPETDWPVRTDIMSGTVELPSEELRKQYKQLTAKQVKPAENLLHVIEQT